MKSSIKYLLIILLSTIGFNAYNQQNNNLFILHQIPQSTHLNPANQIECKYFISIPFLTDLSFSYNNSAFTYNDLAGKESLDLDRVYSQLANNNLISLEADIYTISLGYRKKGKYFSFHIADKAGIYASFPEKLVSLGLTGNLAFMGEPLKFRNLRLNASWYREYSIGYSTTNNYLGMVGIKAKLLFGKANIHTGKSEIILEQDPTTFEIKAEGEMEINSSYPVNLSQNNKGIIDNVSFNHPDLYPFLMNYRNPGIAIDVGIIKQYSEKLNLSASIQDLGFIRWSDNINKVYGSSEFEFTGTGTSETFTTDTFFDEMVDSLVNSSVTEISDNGYFSPLAPKIYLGANYQLQKNLSLGFVNRSILINRRLHTSATFSLNSTLNNVFLTSLNWTIANNSVNQIGGGVAYTGRGFQFHAFTGNLLGFFQPFDSRYLNFQLGMNLLLGCPRSVKQARLNKTSYGKMSQGDCSWTEQSKKKAKYLKKISRKRKY